MNERQPGQPDDPSSHNPYGQPYGSPQTGGPGQGSGPDLRKPSSDEAASSGPGSYGQDPSGQGSYGQAPQPYGQQGSPYGQQGSPYGQQGSPYDQSASPYGAGSAPYGAAPYGQPSSDRRPGTVTAAAWVTIVMASLTGLGLALITLLAVLAKDDFISGMESDGSFDDADIDPSTAYGAVVAVMLGLVVWCVIAVVLGFFVLRRSNVARILLVVSAALTALLSLLGIASGVSAVPMIAAVGTIVLLFVGGANDWFSRRAPAGFPGQGGPGGGYGY